MEYYSVWEHGNAAKIESPEVFDKIRNVGWGTDVYFHTPINPLIFKRKSNIPPCWFHIPMSTRLPIGTFHHTFLLSVEILFSAKNVEITQVDVYDGSRLIHTEHQVLKGNQLSNKDDKIESIETKEFGYTGGKVNTIRLDKPHRVYCGIGISFLAHAESMDTFPSPDGTFEARLNIASAGANFKIVNVLETQEIRKKISDLLGP